MIKGLEITSTYIDEAESLTAEEFKKAMEVLTHAKAIERCIFMCTSVGGVPMCAPQPRYMSTIMAVSGVMK